MPTTTQAEKRQRATAFPPTDDTAPSGLLVVRWDSPFDRLCFLVSRPELARKNNRRYTELLEELMAGSGCTEEEILAHGEKVRAYLFFAEDRLKREGHLAKLTGKEKYAYQLPSVIPAF